MSPLPSPPTASPWQRFAGAALHAFHAYASWLVSISWKRFVLLSILLMLLAAIVSNLPFLRWESHEWVGGPPGVPAPPLPPQLPRHGRSGAHDEGLDITIDENGVRVKTRRSAAASAASAAAASAASAAEQASEADDAIHIPPISIQVPEGANEQTVRDAIAKAKEEIREAIREAKDQVREAAEEARDSAEAAREAAEEADPGPHWRTRTVRPLGGLPDLAFFWIVASLIIKIAYKGRLRAEAQAAEATETAEAESLKRQVVEARMAAMQAQVEPHFLFNTLASIDHLIETDPPRASKMQRNLIALLRASMPTMRETGNGGVRDLGRELAVIRPYLEILKVRMEERLQFRIDVPEGLHSAEFPPMMIQSLVENAIKHGLEPKAEGGTLDVRAEIVHGKLAVTVADTGLGFGKAATAGTGVGLANIRERLQLLYGQRASLTVAENPAGGTVVTVTVPYAARHQEAAA